MDNFQPMSFYKILDVDKTSSSEEIKKAYHKKAMKWHPGLSK
jgi:DnaJ-class molecular chaperone